MSIKRTIIATATIVVAVAMVASVAGAQTPSISSLMAEIAALQAQLNGLSGTTATPAAGTGACAGVTFTRNLTVGSTGSDVKCLQVILNGSATTQVSATGAGSPGYETTTFGPKTLVAVKKFQTANGLTPANQVGPLTRAKLNLALGTVGTTTPVTTLPAGCTSTAGFSPVTGASCATGVVTTVPTGSIAASLAYDSPAAGALVQNEARAGLVNINFTGTGVVTSVTLQRSGFSTSDTLPNVYLFDGATRITSGYSFNTNGTLTMNGLNIAVNGSHEIMVEGDVSSDAINYSSSISVALVGYTANGSAVSAAVQGNVQMIVTGNAAIANFPNGTQKNPGDTTINAGSTNQTLWSQSISISPRAVTLSGMTVKMIGSAPSNTLANVGLYVDGTLAGTAAINANNQFVFAIASPVTLTTGSHLLAIHGDVVGGATRSFYLSLEQGSDVALRDSQLGVYIAATEGSNTTATNINSGLITLGGVNPTIGNLTINQDPAFSNTTTLVGGATNVTLGSFVFTAYGEDTKITSLTFTPTISGTSSVADGSNALNTLSNVGLYINGGQVASNKTATSGTDSLVFSNLGSQLTIPVGTSVTVSLKGDVIAASTNGSSSTNPAFQGANENYASGSVQFAVDAFATQGVSSGSTYSASNTQIGGQQLTVSSSNVTLASATGFSGSTITPNSTAELGAWTLQTGSAEGINLNNVIVTFPAGATGGNTLVSNNQLSNLTLKINGATVNGGNLGGQAVAGSNSFSLNGVVVPINGSIELELYGTIGGNTTCTGNGGGNCNILPYIDALYQGTTSFLQSDYATVNGGAVAGVETTSGVAAIASAGITTSTSLTPQFVTGNGIASPIQIATFNVKSTGNVGGATIRDITFTAAGSSATTGTIGTVTVNGITRSLSLSGEAYTVTVPSVGISVPSDNSGVNIPVTVQLIPVTGLSGSVIANSPVQLSLTKMTYNNGSSVVCDGTGCGSTPNDSSAISATMSASYLVSTVPTISLTSSSTTGLVHGAQQVGTFTIAAGNTGDIKVQNIPFTITVSSSGTASVSNASVYLYDQNGATLDVAPSNNGTLSGSGTFTFAAPYKTISKGTSVTYTVYADIEGTFGSAGQTSVTFGLGNKASFLWEDVTGNVASIGGTYINAYPNTTQSKTN